MSSFFELSNLEDFYRQNPDSIAFAFLASKLLEDDRVEQALSIAESGISKHPQYAFGHYILGLCHHRLNDFAKAKSHLERSVAQNDKNPQAWKLMGEINEKLDLPLVAGECNLQYFLMDSFTRDAVSRFQKEDTVQFNEFENEDSLQFDNPFIGDEEQALPPGPEKDKEASIDDLFSGDENLTGSVDISEKVEAVFKETLGDISQDRPLDESSGEPGNTLEMMNFLDEEQTQDSNDDPDFTLDLTKEDMDVTFDNTGQESLENLDSLDFSQLEENEIPDPQIEDDTSINLDQFFDEYGNPSKTDNDKELNEDALEQDFGDISFADSIADGEPDALKDESEQSLDFSSMVEGIISEQEDEDKTQTSFSENVQPVHDPDMTIQSDDNTTSFGRPPILSPTLGEIYIAQGRFEEAIEVFQQLLEKDPDNLRFQKKISDIQGMLARQK